MEYTTLNRIIDDLIEIPLRKNFIEGQKSGFHRHVTGRIGYMIVTPLSFLACAGDGIIGTAAGICSFIVFGSNQQVWSFARNHLHSAEYILGFHHILRIVNPSAIFPIDRNGGAEATAYFWNESLKIPKIGTEGKGMITEFVLSKIKKFAYNCYESDSFIPMHIISRLSYLLLGIACTVTRVVDGVLGMVTAPISLMTCGTIDNLNIFTLRSLKVAGIANDIFYCASKFINPWAGT